MVFMRRVLKAGTERVKVKRDAYVKTLLNLILYFVSSMVRYGNGISEIGRCSSSELVRRSSTELLDGG
jgi:hypothetical protein